MGIQINGQTDTISATDGSFTISGATLPTAEVTNLNATGIVTATSFSGPLTGNVTGNVTGNLTGTVTSSSGISTVNTLHVTTSIGIGTATPRAAIDAAEKTDAIALPQGTTAQRPTGNNPYIRYNTTNSALEFYNGTDWVEIISDYFPTGSVILG